MPRAEPDKRFDNMFSSLLEAESVKAKLIMKIASARIFKSVGAFKILLEHEKRSGLLNTEKGIVC
jgi:hypothetical protein